jgi:chromatin assembly factor 1 subunit B
VFEKVEGKRGWSAHSVVRKLDLASGGDGKGEHSTTTLTTTSKSDSINASAAASNDNSGSASAATKASKIFADETVNAFFRRLTWTIDGSLLLVPFGKRSEREGSYSARCYAFFFFFFLAGIYVDPLQPKSAPTFATYVFIRSMLSKPIAVLPIQRHPSTCVRCNPKKFKLRSANGSAAIVRLDYRLIWAVATLDSVLVYDSEQSIPIALVEGIHLAELTDLSWY